MVEILLAGGLGLLQGRFGVLHQLVRAAPVFREAGRTALERDGDFAAVDEKRRIGQAQDTLVNGM